jgi:hypothetical protein
MEALGSSETSVLTRDTRRNIPEDSVLQFHNDRDFSFRLKINIRTLGEVETGLGQRPWRVRRPPNCRERHCRL